MRNGFSLVELLVALLILQVGLLATAGLVFLAQENLARSELLTRGLLEAKRVADSLGRASSTEAGHLAYPWGEVRWGGRGSHSTGLRVVVLSNAADDTLAVDLAWPPLSDSILWRPEGARGGEEG